MCPKYQPRKCWETGDTEEYVTCKGDCNNCTVSCRARNVPTFAQLEEAYVDFASKSGGAIRPITVQKRFAALKALYRHSPLEPTDKVTALTEDVWEEFLIKARNHVQPVSLKAFGESIHSLLSVKAIKFFKATRGWDCSPFPHLTAEAKCKPWESLSRLQRQKIRDYQFSLYDLKDPRKYLCVTAAWERGQRKCDALRNTWSNFQDRGGSIWWTYESVKNGKTSSWPVDPDTWIMLGTARRRLQKLKVQHLGEYPDSYLRVRSFARDEVASSAVWNACNDDLRELMGWDGSKAMHNLRKDATDTIFQNLGIDEAEEFSTDTAKTLRKHYVAKKQIRANIPSIAKMFSAA